MISAYFIFDNGVPEPFVKPVVLNENNVDKEKTLIPAALLMVASFVADEAIGVSSIDVDNPHLPIAYSEKSYSSEAEENGAGTVLYAPLEEGQSRRFLYLSQYDNTDIQGEFEHSGGGYFLQPGQSRRFLSLSDNEHIHAEDE